jgi:hypothetical protein
LGLTRSCGLCTFAMMRMKRKSKHMSSLQSALMCDWRNNDRKTGTSWNCAGTAPAIDRQRIQQARQCPFYQNQLRIKALNNHNFPVCESARRVENIRKDAILHETIGTHQNKYQRSHKPIANEARLLKECSCLQHQERQ